MSSTTPLGEFLRARREAAKPHGTADALKRRKTPGSRREDIAVRAGVSADYYARLEQGRERRPSVPVLHALSEALRLDDASCGHLFDLAESLVSGDSGVPALSGVSSPGAVPADAGFGGASSVPPEISRLIDYQLRGPALVLGPWGDILQSNAAGVSLYGEEWVHGNMTHSVFLDPRSRIFYEDWEAAARCSAGVLRMAYGKNPGSERFAEIFEELSARSSDFRRIWAEYPVTRKSAGAKQVNHELAGPLNLTYQLLELPQAPGLRILLYEHAMRPARVQPLKPRPAPSLWTPAAHPGTLQPLTR
ncbi:helix-turn-helix transcriptional regulator [Streptomyces sp. NPDC088725]|uniref:helix-turn-helix transcriptional regulator n=1 Tax=Streptomyces sp. NPDC088725 TaxID=3365873 RepID=UPI003826E891